MPQITARAGRKPEAIALAVVAKTPGPGLAARMSIATAPISRATRTAAIGMRLDNDPQLSLVLKRM